MLLLLVVPLLLLLLLLLLLVQRMRLLMEPAGEGMTSIAAQLSAQMGSPRCPCCCLYVCA